MNEEVIAGVQNWAKRNEAEGLPQITLPGGGVTISECATKLFRLMAPAKTVFVRGGAVVSLITRDDGLLALEVLRPAAARSLFEKFGELFIWRAGADSGPVLKATTCAEEMANALLQSQEASMLLPRVDGLINCPVIRAVGEKLVVAGRGYDEKTRLLVTGGRKPSTVELAEAVSALWALLAEFEFQTDGDKARAVASLISPGLKVGGFLKGRVPADVAEADRSQSGKTYRQKVMAAIYNERLSLVTCREGGVGSIDESLSQQLLSGRPFIQFDNFRGRFESAHLEAFLTAEGSFPCRVPHRGEISVPPENYFVFLTSNGVDTTRDFANRSNIIRIRKRPPGFAFTTFPEGDLLARVREQQAYYLGCVFAVIREWWEKGKPRTEETRHDFREWVQTVDWIAQNIFGTAPVMDGHQEAQERVSNPGLIWLRKVVLQIADSGRFDVALTATEIFGICDDAGIDLPGARTVSDEERGKRAIGSLMGKLFKEKETLEVDAYKVTREEKYVARENATDGGGFKSKTYTVTRK